MGEPHLVSTRTVYATNSTLILLHLGLYVPRIITSLESRRWSSHFAPSILHLSYRSRHPFRPRPECLLHLNQMALILVLRHLSQSQNWRVITLSLHRLVFLPLMSLQRSALLALATVQILSRSLRRCLWTRIVLIHL